jgi:hypothetical protein
MKTLVVVCVVAFAVLFFKNVHTVEPATSITVKCKDGSEYLTSLDSEEDFKCKWDYLQFNF